MKLPANGAASTGQIQPTMKTATLLRSGMSPYSWHLCHTRSQRDTMDATEALLRLPPDIPPLERLCSFLVEAGQCDARTIERGRRVGKESGQRVDRVLLQLGLVSERGLAEAFAAIFRMPLARPEDYPTSESLFAERLPDRFLRGARAMPLAETADEVLVAVADPLDEFTPSAIAAATSASTAPRCSSSTGSTPAIVVFTSVAYSTAPPR